MNLYRHQFSTLDADISVTQIASALGCQEVADVANDADTFPTMKPHPDLLSMSITHKVLAIFSLM